MSIMKKFAFSMAKFISITNNDEDAPRIYYFETSSSQLINSRAGSSGMVYDMIIYDGADTFNSIKFRPSEKSLGFSSKIVLALCQSIASPALTSVYFDNFFTSMELLHLLRRNHGILAIGTVRKDRLRGGVFESVKKPARGSVFQIVDNDRKIVLVKWIDNREVLLAPNYLDSYPMDSKSKYSKTDGKRIDIPCPNIVMQYNEHMAGVDLQDMMIALFRSELRSKRWYLRLFGRVSK